jgi:8-oxo-dGTP pyrophosphatase MutT (NUDIX family)
MSTDDETPPAWRHLETESLQDCKVFSVSRTLAESPHTGDRHPFYRIDAGDWVNVVPVTPEGEIVMVRQFRHGSRRVTLEVPGGMVDPGETPAEAAARELLEETGYRGDPARPLGVVNPNPALFGNSCHTYVVDRAIRVAEIANGETEETVVELVPGDSVHARLRSGDIDHALVVAALYWYDLQR